MYSDNMPQRLILLLACLNLAIPMQATPSFHAILVAATKDASIGLPCQVDLHGANSRFAAIAQQLDYRYQAYILQDTGFGVSGLVTTLQSVQCTSEDIIAFYYTGHGFNARQHQSDFPLLQFNPTTDKVIPSLDAIHALLLDKKPRFCLTVGDCCNKLIEEGLPAERSLVKGTTCNGTIFRQLFLEKRGGVLVASSKRGQLSGASPNGSHFTWALLQSLDYACHYNESVSWEQLLADTQNRMQNIAMARMSGQQSIYRITEAGTNLSEGGVVASADTLLPPVPDTPEPTVPAPVVGMPPADSSAMDVAPSPDSSAAFVPAPPVLPSAPAVATRPAFSDVNLFLNALVDESKPFATRKQLQRQAGSYFVHNARVRVFVGSTQVEQMPLAELMNRYNLLAAKIRQVNIIETLSKLDPSGRYYVEVALQEIWK
jgi:hypothetical protein